MPEDPGLGLWIGLVRRRFRFLFLTAFLAGVAGLIVAFLLPKWYQAHASVFPPRQTAPLLPLAGLEEALQLEGQLPFEQRIGRYEVFLGILASDAVARRLVERFDLRTVYDVKTRDDAVRALRKHTRFGPTADYVLRVDVEDRDPARAAALANAYVEELDRIYREAQSSSAGRQRVFLEERLARARAELDSLEAELARVQEAEGVTVFAGDVSEAARTGGDLMTRRLAVQVQLDMLEAMGVGSVPLRERLREERAALDREIGDLPGVGMELARLLRDLRIREVLHGALAEQLEAARVEEVRATPVVEILDRAVPPQRKSRPRRGAIAVVAALFGGALALGFAAWQEGQRPASSPR